MNKSTTENISLEPQPNNELKADEQQVSPAIGNTNVSSRYVVQLCCSDCGEVLNQTIEMSAKEIYDEWSSLVIGSAFASGKCKNGCRSTFSDCNINTDMKIFDMNKGCIVDKDSFFNRSYNGC